VNEKSTVHGPVAPETGAWTAGVSVMT
jgi:hypothetical protein